MTGLEPVRLLTHAPQTCLSTSSSTLAFLFPGETRNDYYNHLPHFCQPLFFKIPQKFFRSPVTTCPVYGTLIKNLKGGGAVEPITRLLARSLLPPRDPDGHKGTFGKVYVYGGCVG